MSKDTCYIVYHDSQLWSFTLNVQENRLQTRLACHQRAYKDGSLTTSSATNETSLVIAHSNLEVLDCRVVAESHTNLRKLFVLLGDDNQFNRNIFLVAAEEKGLRICMDFVCSKETSLEITLKQTTINSESSFYCEKCHEGQNTHRSALSMNNKYNGAVSAVILDGPNVCIASCDGIYCTLSNGLQRILKRLCFTQEKVTRNIHAYSLLFCVTHNGYFTYLLSLETSECDNPKRELIVFTLNKQTDIRNIDPSSILPTVYCDILTCIEVISFCSTNTENLELPSSKFEAPPLLPKLKSNILICTSQSQLLDIQNGHVADCVWVPFSCGKSIHMFESSSGFTYIAVLSDQQSCCIVDKEKFCVLVVVEYVGHAFVGDFAQNGAEQLLLLSSLAHDMDHFLLTDLNLIHYDTIQSSQDDVTNNSPTSSSLCSALAALTTRLHAGLSMILDRQQQCDSHADVIQQTCVDLQQLSFGEQQVSPLESPGNTTGNFLVPLLGVTSESYPENSKTSDTLGLRCSAPWTRVISGKCVVGVEVFNGSKGSLANPELHVMCSGHYRVLHAQSRCLHYHCKPRDKTTNSMSQSQVGSKKRKIETCESCTETFVIQNLSSISSGQTATLVCCVDKPQVDKTEKWGLLLLWQKDKAKDNNDENRVMIKSCGEVDIQVTSLFKSLDAQALLVTSEVETLLSLHALQHSLTLTLQSRVTSVLPSLLDVLTQQLGFQYYGPLDCYLATQVSSIGMLRVNVQEYAKCTATIVCHFLEEQHILLFIHLLYDHLPQDVLIQPIANQKVRHKQLMAAVKTICDEVSYCTKSLKDVLSHSKSAGNENGEVMEAREEFEWTQKRLLSVNQNLCDKEVLSKVLEMKAKYEKVTDEQISNIESH